MSQDFGIRLGAEHVTARQQARAQLDIVLDDAVVDHRQLPAAIGVRMRVHVIRHAVGRPARVPDAERTVRRISIQHRDQLL